MLSSLILHNNKPLLGWIVMCDKNWILHNNQLSGWTEMKLQSTSQCQTCTKEKKQVLVTVWLSAAHLIHYSFLNLGKTINIWEVCSAN